MGWRPGVAPLGYMNRAFAGVKHIIVDPDRGPVVTEMFQRAAQGWSGRRLKLWLDEVGFTNRSGCKVALSQVYLMLNNSFYYSEFEYPEGSGKVYKGSHPALVTKELFSQVQDSRALPNKALWGSKHLAFKGIFKCPCGADITAEEKFKPLKDGTFNRHVYYHCTRKVNYDCPEKYVSEPDLIGKLKAYIVEHAKEIKVTDDLDRLARQHAEVVERSLSARGVKGDQIDPLVEYSEFILSQGTYKEQAQLVEGIKTTFAIKDREIRPLTKGEVATI